MHPFIALHKLTATVLAKSNALTNQKHIGLLANNLVFLNWVDVIISPHGNAPEAFIH